MDFWGKFREGRFIAEDGPRFAAYVAHVGDRRIRVAFNRESESHSSKQRRYYFAAVVATVSEWSGHTKEETHYFLKKKFLVSPEIILPTGEIMEGEPSTKKLSSDEMSEYIMRCSAWAAESGLYIPSAEEM